MCAVSLLENREEHYMKAMNVWMDCLAAELLSTAGSGEFCLTSTEAIRPVRDGDEWGKGELKSETSKQAPTRKTEAAVDRRQNNRMLRKCPSGIAQRPPHHAVAVPTAMQNRVTRTMLENN